MNDVFSDSEQKRNEFRQILHSLARDLISSPELLTEYYQKFEKLYDNGFRHYYSDIARVMYDIAKYDRSIDGQVINEDVNTLCMNISYIVENYPVYKSNNEENGVTFNDIGDKLAKLFDHISLESIRMDYSDLGDRRTEKQGMTLVKLSASVKQMNNKFQSMKRKSVAMEDKLSKAQTDYIAILGIFASVVLAFVGGMAFSTSVLENIKDVSIYRLLIVALIIGIVFVTVIFLMFYFIGVLTGRHLNDERSIHPLLLSYGLFILLIAIVYAMWYHGDVETRNKRVDDQATIIEISVEPDVTSQIYFEQNNATTE